MLRAGWLEQAAHPDYEDADISQIKNCQMSKEVMVTHHDTPITVFFYLTDRISMNAATVNDNNDSITTNNCNDKNQTYARHLV
jgi:hypothetical protein